MTDLWIALASVAFVAVVAGGARLMTVRRRPRPQAPPADGTGPATRPPSTRPPRTRPARPPAEAPPGEAPAPVPTPPASDAPQAPPAPAPPGTRRPASPEVQPTPAAPSFRSRLSKTRGVFAGLRSLRGRGVEPATWDELEETLLRADMGVATSDALLGDLRRQVAAKEIAGGAQLVDALRTYLVDLLDVEHRWDAATDAELAAGNGAAPGSDLEVVEPVGRDLRFDEDPGLVNVWLFVGVNGVGKTTTVGKVARQQTAAGRSVLLAAGDTFRAAAGEQLATWAERAGVEIVRGAEGADPSAIVFDAVQRAAARGNQLVLADTAGRLHTKVNLVEELKKIRRVADRPPGRVTEVLLVLDATTGQNGLAQARQFTEAVAVTGVALTKLDGTAKGGIVVAIQRELGLPVKLVGLGEGPDDLVPFDPAEFVAALLA
jgi:fused signal recognition particle receptor